ncbi:hypothetical protein ACFPYM_14575, partial [Methylobacterium hispanicum]
MCEKVDGDARRFVREIAHLGAPHDHDGRRILSKIAKVPSQDLDGRPSRRDAGLNVVRRIAGWDQRAGRLDQPAAQAGDTTLRRATTG